MDLREVEQVAGTVAHLFFEGGSAAALSERLTPDCPWIGMDGRKYTLDSMEGRRVGRINREEYLAESLGENEAGVTARLLLHSNGEALSLCVSMILRQVDGRWQVIHAHNSLLAPDAALVDQAGAAARRISARIERARLRDALTGIQNMDGFAQTVQRIRARQPAQPFAFIKFTINHFRLVNQMYGFDFGDEVLRSIAQCLERSCTADEACCRVEKDNFAMLWAFDDKERFEKRMHCLREQMLSPEILARLNIRITFTAGVYLPEVGADEPVKVMLDKALAALQGQSSQDRNNNISYFQPEAYERQRYQSQLLGQAPGAMARDEFRLYIQPQVDLQTLEVVAGEALTRWVTPDGTIIMPGSFIPLFEREGMILEFDYHMLGLICRHVRRWLDEGLPGTPISINQSRLHVKESGYLERFLEIVDRHQIPHTYLAFELTESAFAEERTQMTQLARQLHRHSFQLEIDDFGTGYAALSLVTQLEADVLKMDKSLLWGLEDDPDGRCRKVLQKVIEMAHETGMTVVCEGVETAGQAQTLRELGCDIAQGFYFYRPMPADIFEQTILRRVPCRPGRKRKGAAR